MNPFNPDWACKPDCVASEVLKEHLAARTPINLPEGLSEAIKLMEVIEDTGVTDQFQRTGKVREALALARGCLTPSMSISAYDWDHRERALKLICIALEELDNPIDVDALKFECTKHTDDETHIRIIFNTIDHITSRYHLIEKDK